MDYFQFLLLSSFITSVFATIIQSHSNAKIQSTLQQPSQFQFDYTFRNLSEDGLLLSFRVGNISWLDEIRYYDSPSIGKPSKFRLLEEYSRYGQMSDSERVKELKDMALKTSRSLSKNWQYQRSWQKSSFLNGTRLHRRADSTTSALDPSSTPWPHSEEFRHFVVAIGEAPYQFILLIALTQLILLPVFNSNTISPGNGDPNWHGGARQKKK